MAKRTVRKNIEEQTKALYEWVEETLPSDHVESFLALCKASPKGSPTAQISYREFEKLKNEILPSMMDVSWIASYKKPEVFLPVFLI